jgi:hypothetical protein
MQNLRDRFSQDYKMMMIIIIIKIIILISCSTVFLEKLTSLQLVKKFPAFYGTRKFITAFTSARQLSVSWASTIHSIPTRPTYWSSILILSTPGSPQWSLSLMFPHQNPVHASLLPHPSYILHTSNCSLFYHPHNIGWGVQIMEPFVMKFSPLPCYLVPLSP